MLFLDLPPLPLSSELLSLTASTLPLYREPLSAVAQPPKGVTAQLRLCTARHTEGIVSTGGKGTWELLGEPRLGYPLRHQRWEQGAVLSVIQSASPGESQKDSTLQQPHSLQTNH